MTINLSPKIVVRSLYYLLAQSNKNIPHCYFMAILDIVKPTVVIENTHIAHLARLASVYRKIQFIVVLNGYWLNIRDGLYGSEELYHKQLARVVQTLGHKIDNYHIYTFGAKDIEIFEDEGLGTAYSGIRYHPVGSMMGDAYGSRHRLQKADFDIVWVSQCSSETLRGSMDIQRLLRDQTIVAASLVSKYATQNCLSLLIQLRSPLEDEELEMDFYSNLYAELPIPVSFSRNMEIFSAYDAVSRASLVTSIHSTLGYESMNFGKRVIFFHLELSAVLKVSSSKHSDDNEIWPWIIVDSDYDSFEMKVDELRMLDDSLYRERTNPLVAYLMSGGRTKLANIALREDIAKFIEFVH